MQMFCVKPAVSCFDRFHEFVEAFSVGEGDLLLTEHILYEQYVRREGLSCAVFLKDQYDPGEPREEVIDAILQDMKGLPIRRVIAMGGGSVIDIAKILCVKNAYPCRRVMEMEIPLALDKELVVLPTTCGTGSEVTNLSIINRTRIGTKMGLASAAMFADHAVLIPELLSSLPFAVFATSSIDALVHAVESSLSPKATPYTKLFGYKAIEMIIKGYQVVVKEGQGAVQALMEDFLIASNYAGIAFGTAGCAAVHAMSYPLGGAYHVAHGESNYAIFTGVLKNYIELKQDGEIAVMNAYLAKLLDCDVAVVYDKLEELLNQLLPKKPLREYGVTEADLSAFTEVVMTKQGRLMANNFVPLDADRVLKIYKELY